MIGARRRRLSPLQEDTVRALYAQGVRAQDLASTYDVSVRCIYRTIERTPVAVVPVTIGGYYAQFEITEDGPVQRTDWRAAA